MSKTIKFLFVASTVLAFTLIFAGQANAQAASGCVTGSWANITGNGAQAKLNVTNRANCAAKQVSLCSYRVYIRPNAAGWLSSQTLFDSQVITLQPGQTMTMAVNTDNCMTQVDAYEGPCVNPFTSDNTSVPYIFAGRMTDYTETMCVKCTNECSTDGQRVCDGNGFKQCNKGADGCFHWNRSDCDANQICSGGSCIASCSDECTIMGERKCDGNGYKECGNFDSDSCKEWGTVTNCAAWQKCSNGSCSNNQPTVDLTSSGNVACNRSATLNWTSTNADACSASGAWSGNKATSGSEAVGNFTGSKTFTLTCTNGGGEATDSVTITGQSDTLEANAVPDQDADAGDSVTLEGSVSGDGFGGSPEISWSCNGGNLSNSHSLRPTLRVDEDSDDETYTCTMTARTECGSDSDTMKVEVSKKTYDFRVALETSPASGCAPLRDVDLVAKLSNYGNGNQEYTYYFDCENDGDWDKTVTTDDTRYTASNLCGYSNIGTYTAKVKVTSQGRTVTDTATVRAENCEKPVEVQGNVSITKTVRDVNSGTGYMGTVTANPNGVVSYRIVVTGISGKSDNVIVRDVQPVGIINVRNVQVNGYSRGGNLASGIDLGTMIMGDSRTITYDATVAAEGNFSYGQTTLTNTATVTANGTSANSSAAVQVYRRAVQGATTVSTGFDGNMFAGIGLGIMGAILSLAWLMRERLTLFIKNDPKTQLTRKIAFIKASGLAR